MSLITVILIFGCVLCSFSNLQACEIESSHEVLGNRTSNVKQQRQVEQHQYAVVVDCGSSGTRAAIYWWPRQTPSGELAGKIQPLRDARTGLPLSLRIQPGLASVRNSPDYASEYMRPIMQFAQQNIPAREHSQTPVYVMGTGGMRLLEGDEQQAILDDLVRDLGREYSFPELRAEVISGLEEGVFQWVSINALAGRLSSQFDLPRATSWPLQLGAQTRRRLGLVEMGGASAQVAFEVSPSVNELVRRRLGKHQAEAWRVFRTSGLELDLYGDRANDVAVFSVSFLGFGSDSARHLAVDLLVRDSLRLPSPWGLPFSVDPNPAIALDDPCLPQGAEEAVQKPLELFYNPTKTIGYGVKSNRTSLIRVKLVGRGNYARCAHFLKRLAFVARRERTTCALTGKTKREPCEAPLIGTHFIPWQQFQFIGLGQLFYTTHEMFNASGRFDGPLVATKSAKLCSTEWRALEAQFPARNELERRRNLLACFKATWMLTWLQFVLRMPINGKQSVDLRTASQVGGVDVDWKLGSIITRTINAGERS